MKHTHIHDKLAAYSAMAAGFFATTSLDAQIFYSDIDPDDNFNFVLDDPNYMIYPVDFNSDGIQDINLILYTYGYVGGWTMGTTSTVSYSGSTSAFIVYAQADILENNFIVHDAGDPNDIKVIGEGSMIDELDNWNNDSSPGNHILFNSWYTFTASSSDEWTDEGAVGNWLDQTGKFIGVKFLIDGNYHFGWIRLSTSVNLYGTGFMSIHDFAYEETPGSSIIAGEIPSCLQPTPLGAAMITGTTAKLKWEAMPGVEHYELQYMPVGEIAWTTKNVNGLKTFRKVAGLGCDSNYEWRIRSVCTDGEISAYSATLDFTTASCRLENEDAIDEENITIFTHSNQIYVSIEEDLTEPANLTLYDQLGRIVFEDQITQEQNVFSMDIPDGIYIVTLSTGSGTISKALPVFR